MKPFRVQVPKSILLVTVRVLPTAVDVTAAFTGTAKKRSNVDDLCAGFFAGTKGSEVLLGRMVLAADHLTPGLVAHESSHAADHLAVRCCISLEDVEEFRATVVGDLTDRIWRRLQ